MPQTELQAFLADLARASQSQEQELCAILEGLGETAANWRPEPKRWSLLENVEHMNIALRAYLPAYEKATATLRERDAKGSGPYRWGRISSWFVRQLEPPVTRRFPAPKIFHPAQKDLLVSEQLAEFCSLQTALREAMAAASPYDLAAIKLRSPASALVRLELGKAFEVMVVHQRRHLWTMSRILALPDFPLD